MGIKLIASDLDGTFLTDKKEITPALYQVMKKVYDRGIVFVPATGRAFDAVPDRIVAMDAAKYVITSNGAAIYCAETKERIYECLLKRQSVEAVLGMEISPDVAIEAFVRGVPYSEKEYIENPKAYGATEYGAVYVKNTRHGVDDIRDFIREHKDNLDSLSFVCAFPERREQFRLELKRKVPDIYITSSVSHMLEIGNQDAGKGKTLLHLLALLDISPQETAAFGDADNDSDMLAAVKYGVAMANGTELCKKSAAIHTGSNNEDGVANAVIRLLEMKE